jgi:hypothetical protein
MASSISSDRNEGKPIASSDAMYRWIECAREFCYIVGGIKYVENGARTETTKPEDSECAYCRRCIGKLSHSPGLK